MSKSRQEVLAESRRKGAAAALATGATVALGVVAFPVGLVAAVPAAVLVGRWWNHRAKNGIKF